MLKGKTVFITGTNRGIGKATVEKFAKNGANIIAHARKETPEFFDFLREISEKYSIKIHPVFFDMTDTEAMKNTVRQIIADKIPVDVLVNSAGVAHGGLFQMTSMAKIKEVFEINFFSHLQLTQLLLRWMIKNGGGSVINFGSVLGLDLPAGSCAYGVSKAALIAFTKTLAAECGQCGVRVNAVAPGLIDTDMAKQMEKNAEEEMLEDCAMKRLGKPEEIANTVIFLASDASSFINGQIIRVDGGKS